jgi:hypothetical protein
MNQPKLPSFFYPLGVLAFAAMLFYPFEGGLFINLFGRAYLILPPLLLVLILIIGLVNSLLSAFMGREKLSPLKKYSALAFLTVIAVHWVTTSELFKSDILLTAALNDDLFHEHLVLRADGSCEVETTGWLGYNEIEKSQYTFNSDTLRLNFSGDAVPPFGNLLLVDTAQKAIYFKIDSVGQFNKELEWLNYLEIYNVENSLWTIQDR